MLPPATKGTRTMTRAVLALAVALTATASLWAAGSSAAPRSGQIQQPTVLRLATEVGYAPYEVYAADGKTLEGLDVDLWTALGKLLNIDFKVQDGTYADIIPALDSKRADIGWSAMALSSFVGLKQAK